MPATFSNTNPNENLFIQRLTPTNSNIGSDYNGVHPMQYALNSTMLAIGLSTARPFPGLDPVGAVLIYKLINGVWSQDALVTASDPASNDSFGYSFSLSEDGLHLVVGARREDSSGSTDNGAFYYFTRSGSAWTQQQKVLPPEGMGSDTSIEFGSSVKLSNDSNVLFVGAPNRDGTSLSNAGKVYIYTRNGSTWTYSTSIVSSDLSISDWFGFSLDLSSDGTTLVVGAPGESINYASTPFNNGAVYIFTGSGTSWTQQGGKLNASDPGTGDNLGLRVRISSNGNTVIASAPYWNSSNIGSGAVYVFTRSGTTWSQLQRLNVPTITVNEDLYGGMSISPDGNAVVVGASGADISPYDASGAVYVYSRSGSTFSLVQTILPTDAVSNTRFGLATVLNSTGDLAVITTQTPVRTYIYKIGKKLDNKFYFYNSISNKWEVSFYTETLQHSTSSYTSSGNWVVPLGAKIVNVTCIGAGGGGGGGGSNNTGDAGGTGGGGGGISEFMFRASDLGGAGTSISITVGAGGAGGAGRVGVTTAAQTGGNGGSTLFGNFLQGQGGSGGLGGPGYGAGAGGFGMFIGNTSGSGGASLYYGGVTDSLSTLPGAGGGGGAGATPGVGSRSTTTNIAIPVGGGASGTSNALYLGPGSGGNGGASSTSTGSNGGSGGLYGGGGGGGGEGFTGGGTGNGGAGGAGASGVVVIRVWYG